MTDDRYPPVPPPPPPPAAPLSGLAPQTVPHAAAAPQWQPPPGYPTQPGSRRRRVPGWLVAVAAATAVASVASFLSVLLWPGNEGEHRPAGPLTFTRFDSVARIDFDQPSNTTLAAVQGERGYTAWEQGGDLRVVAFDVSDGTQRWRGTVSGAPQWSRLIAAPDVLLALAHESDPAAPRRMFAVDPDSGQVRWHVDVRGGDQLFFLEEVLGWLDQEGRALRGLDLDSGAERWAVDFSADGETTAVGALAPADLARPSDLRGAPSPGTGDHRIVLVNADRSARVIDGNDGRTLSEAANIASPGDLLLGYSDRLFVAADEAGYQLVSYDLADLSGLSRNHYTAPGTDRYPVVLEPCGAQRVCLLEYRSFDAATTELVAVDASQGGERWRVQAPEAEHVLSIGEWVGVMDSLDYDPAMDIFDGSGDPVLDSPGLPVRLNDGNLLLVTTAGSYEDILNAQGIAIEDWDGDPVDLGRLPEGVQDEQCSWNERHIVCPDRTGVEIWRFAEA